MASNIDVKITADVADLVAKAAIARAESRALSQELNKLATEAAKAGGTMSAEMQAGLQAAAAASAKAKAELAEINNQLKAATGSSSSFSSVLSTVKGGLASLGVAITAGAMLHLGETIEENTAHLQHQADVLQLNVTAYQAFRQAAIDSGVGVDITDTALERFSKSVGDAQEGIGPAAKAFVDMGISVNQSKEALLQQVSAFMLHADANQRDLLATELFSRKGMELIPLFNQWAEGADNLTAKYDALGRMIDPTTTRAAEQADIRLQGAWQHMEAAAAGPVATLTGALATLVDTLARVRIDDIGVISLAAAPTVPKPKPVAPPPAPGEGDEIKALDAIDSKMRQRDELTKEVAQAQKTLNDAEKAGDPAGAKRAAEAYADLKKQLDSLNKPEAVKFGGGFSNEGDKEIKDVETKNEAIKANEALTAQEIFAQQEANWQRILDGHRLNAAQIDAVDKQMSALRVAYQKQAAQEISAEEKSDLQRDLSLAKDALSEKKTLLSEEFAAHKIDAQARYDDTVDAINAEITAERAAQQQIIDDTNSTVLQKHEAANQEIILDAQKNDAIAAAGKQLTADLKAEDNRRLESWKAVDSEILSSESTLVSDIFTKRQGLGADLAEIGMKIAQDEVTNLLKTLTEHELVNAGMLASDKATANESLIYKLFSYSSDTASKTASEGAKVAAVTAGQAAQTGAVAAGTAASKAVTTAATAETVSQDAAKAGAGAYSAVVGIPIIGPFIAPIAAGVAFAAVEAFGSFDKGTNLVPQDMVAKVHAGERIVPAADNAKLISAIGSGAQATGETHLHYAPTIIGSTPKSLQQMVEDEPEVMRAWFQSQVRDGYIKVGS